MKSAIERGSFSPTEVLNLYFPDSQEARTATVLKVFQDNVIMVEVSNKQYVIKQYPQSVSPKRAKFVTALQNEVNRALGILPSVIVAKDKQLFVELGGNVYDVTEFVTNFPVNSTEVLDAAKFLYLIGSLVGSLHREAAKFDVSRHSEIDAILYIHSPRENHFRALLKEYTENCIAPEWCEIIKIKALLSKHYSAVAGIFSNLPRGIIHGDIYMNNILFDEDQEVKGLIDFEQAGVFLRSYEVFRAFMQINTYFRGISIDPKDLIRFLNGYLSQNSLEEIELKIMVDLYLYAQAADISFLDIQSVVENGKNAEYARVRFNNLLLLHENREALTSAISEIYQVPK